MTVTDELVKELRHIHRDGTWSAKQPDTPHPLCTKAADRIEAQAAEIERLRAEAEAHYDRGYYDGSTHPIVRHDALREALADLLHAVCGEKGFAEAVRRDSGRVYPWPALELAEAKALAALGQSK